MQPVRIVESDHGNVLMEILLAVGTNMHEHHLDELLDACKAGHLVNGGD